MNRTLLLCLLAAVLITGACGAKTTTTTNATAPTNTPAAAAKKTAEKGADKKPPAAKAVPVPANWITMSDDVKGYSFQVPDGTKHETQTVNGVDVYVATVPEPNQIAVMVFAFKDKKLSKEDLLKSAEAAFEAMGEKDIKLEGTTELSDDYSLVTITSRDKDGKASKGRVLVGTDVTDNYVVIVVTDTDKFDANSKTIDEIWGSFSMHSGGASGNS